MRLGRALGGITLVVVIGGCTSSPSSAPAAPATSVTAGPAASAPAFREPAAYRYVLTRGCDDAAPRGRYRVTVRDGSVATTERLGAAAAAPTSTGDVDLGPVTGTEDEEIEAFTLRELLDMAQTAEDDGGEVSRTLDTTDGHPVEVSINVSEEGPAGAECFTVSDYTVGS